MFLRCFVLTPVLNVGKFVTLNAVSLCYELDKPNFIMSFKLTTAYKLSNFHFAAILRKMGR